MADGLCRQNFYPCKSVKGDRYKVVFKRRDQQSWGEYFLQMIYPKGGFRRAMRYVYYRMRRLPDTPERIARGVFVGFLVGCLPLPGMQFFFAVLLAWMFRGNILAALLGTFNSNPITTPFIAVFSIGLGHWILGVESQLTASTIASAFIDAGEDIIHNSWALLGYGKPHWGGLLQFWETVYLPYLLGAFIIGILTSMIAYYIALWLVRVSQKVRALRLAERKKKLGAMKKVMEKAKVGYQRAVGSLSDSSGNG